MLIALNLNKDDGSLTSPLVPSFAINKCYFLLYVYSMTNARSETKIFIEYRDFRIFTCK